MDYSEIIQTLKACSYWIESTLDYVNIPFEPATLAAKTFDAETTTETLVIDSPFLDNTYASMRQLNGCIKPIIDTLTHNAKPTKEQIQNLLNHSNAVLSQITGCWNGELSIFLENNLQYIIQNISMLL